MFVQFIKKNIVFIKYSIVGVSSTLVDLVFLYIFVDIFKINLYFGVVFSFLLAVINGFILNKIWTFQNKSNKYKRQFAKFLLVSIIGLFLTLILMYIFVDFLNVYYLFSKVFTSIIVLFWNYFGNRFWTFTVKTQNYIKPEKQNFPIKY
ncbi:MAG: GtrA family protein [Candidatus Gracilibacteria bacterium]|nr:GtrA family protein [Candidatus Gracilibacteria bacterium]